MEFEQAGPKDQLTLLAESMNLFDQSEEFYFTACSDYFKHPTEAARRILVNAVDSHSDAFRVVVDVMMRESPLDDELAHECAGLIRGSDTRRSAYLNELTDQELTGSLKETFDLSINGEYEEDDEDEVRNNFLFAAWQVFNNYLFNDTDLLLDASRESPNAKRVERTEFVRKHAVDVGKVALGVFVGIWAARKLSR